MQVHTLDISVSAAEATEWVAPLLDDAGIESLVVAFAAEGIQLSGCATRPFSMPFTVTLTPRVEGRFLWLELQSVQAAGPLGSWLQGPLLSLAASRLEGFGVVHEGKALGVDIATVAAPYAQDIEVETLDVGLATDQLRIRTCGSFRLLG